MGAGKAVRLVLQYWIVVRKATQSVKIQMLRDKASRIYSDTVVMRWNEYGRDREKQEGKDWF